MKFGNYYYLKAQLGGRLASVSLVSNVEGEWASSLIDATTEENTTGAGYSGRDEGY